MRAADSNSPRKTRKKKSVAFEQQDIRFFDRTSSQTPHTQQKRIKSDQFRKEPALIPVKTERKHKQKEYLKENIRQLLQQVQELKKRHTALENVRQSLSIKINEIKSHKQQKRTHRQIEKKLHQIYRQSQNHQQSISILSLAPEIQDMFYPLTNKPANHDETSFCITE